MNLVKKFSVFALMIATVVSMSGGLTVKAAGNYSAGSLLAKANTPGAAVYYIGSDGMKYVFPDVKTYNTWYENFDNVVKVSVSELDMYPDGGAVTYREGSYLVTHADTAKVYAIEPGGTLRWIPTAETAAALYGANWGSKVMDVIPGFFSSSYTMGSDLGSTLPTGTIAMEQGGTTYYRIDGTTKRPFASMDAFEANNFNLDFVVTADLSGYTTGTSITGQETALSGFMPAEGNGNGNQTGGNLSVSLASKTPSAMPIPYNVQGFVYTTLKLTAGSQAVDVTGVTVKRTGLGFNDDFERVYVEVDGMRHGTKRTLGSDGEADVNFATTASKITVPAGQTVYLDIVADMSAYNVINTVTTPTSGNYSALQVTEIQTNGSTSGSLPVTGNYMTVTSISVATAEVDINNNEGEVTIGEEQVEVGMFTVTNESTDEDISFEAIALKNFGTADNTEVINYTLYNEDDEAISDAVEATGDDFVLLTLDDAMLLEDGESHEFTVKADISSGKDETVKLGLDDVTDFQATGLDNNFSVTAALAESLTADDYTIVGGDLTISKASNNPSNQEVAPETDNVVFLLANAEAADEAIVVTELDLTCTDSGNSGAGECDDLEDITIYLDDVVVAGPISGTDTANSNGTITFEDEFEVFGEQVLKVVADIGEMASGTYTISLNSDSILAEDAEGDDIADEEIVGSANGNSVSVAVGTATLVKDGTYGNQTMVAGAEGFLVGRFILEASDYEDVRISNYKVQLLTTGDLAISDIDEFWISESTSRKSSSLTATSTFTVSQTLEAGEHKVISVYATIDSAFASTGTIRVGGISAAIRGDVSSETETVVTYVGQSISVAAGDLILTNVADDDMESKTVIGGNTYEVGKWNLESDNVGHTITKVIVEAHKTNTTNTTAVIAAELNGVAGTVVNGRVEFDTDIRVDSEEDIDLVLEATFNDDFNTVTSGADLEFAIVGLEYTADNDTSLVESNDYSSTGELMYVRKSDVTVTTVAKDTTLTATTKMMDITFTADAVGKVNIETATFEFNFHDDTVVSGATLTIDKVELKTSSGAVVTSTLGTVPAGWDADDYEDGLEVKLTNLGLEIAAGTSKTYTLVITVANYATEDYINVKMLEDTSTANTYFSWDDDESASLVSGWLVDGLESDVYEALRP